jgi:hypothetical protein
MADHVSEDLDRDRSHENPGSNQSQKFAQHILSFCYSFADRENHLAQLLCRNILMYALHRPLQLGFPFPQSLLIRAAIQPVENGNHHSDDEGGQEQENKADLHLTYR